MGPQTLISKHATLPVSEQGGGRHEMPAAVYVRAYEAGWRHSGTDAASLDNQPSGRRGWAWEDGYLDYATDKKKWHRATCEEPNHEACPERY